MKIRKARLDDLSTIKTLYNQLTTDSENVEKDFPIILNDSNSVCFILGEPTIGMAMCYVRTSLSSGKKMVIDEIIVDNQYRGRGYGHALTEHCIATAKKMDVDCVELACSLTRPDLHTFYENMGFEHVMRLYQRYLGNEKES